jgi:hypothetical protein
VLSKRQLTITAAVSLGLLSVVVVGFTMRARTTDSSTLRSPSAEPRFEAELITIREWGCEPQQINRPVGPFMLVVQNQSGLPEIDLSLVEESGRPRHKLPDANALRWKQRLELPPGAYSIKEASHPDWQCQITIGN